jgi:pimeloyl-ACP methyl ester carboxylesterase
VRVPYLGVTAVRSAGGPRSHRRCVARRSEEVLLTDHGKTAPDALHLTTRDGIALSALRYGPTTAEIGVAFGHGFTGSQRNPKVVDFVGRLADAGIACYTADFRGHGASGGLSTLGDREVDDIDVLVTTAREHHRLVVSIGASMGGFVALRHAALGGAVDGVISISSPATANKPQLARARLLRRVVSTEQGRRLLVRYGTRVGTPQPAALTPGDLAAIAPVPVAIVHGRRDRYVPVADAHALFEQLAEPRRLVVLEHFGHGEAGFDTPFATQLVALVFELCGRD